MALKSIAPPYKPLSIYSSPHWEILPMLKTKAIVLFLLLIPFAATNSSAQITYDSATFGGPIVTISNENTLQVQSTVFEGGFEAGTLISTFSYGGGTNPFNFPNWSGGDDFNAVLNSTPDIEQLSETADGSVDFLLIPNAGWQSSGLSIFSSGGTAIGNPVYSNVVSSTGSGTISDALQGLSNELIGNFDDGDTVVNGSSIVFNPGSTATGISESDHTRNWSYDSAGSTNISFDYQAGPVSNISLESIRLEAALVQTSAVPEPSSAAILCLLAGVGCMRRRRR